jgi:3-hydroxyisobutyrate dehydrogenase
LNIGIAGTGRMGAAIARRLLSLGHAVTVWNRTAEKTRAIAAAGAQVALTPAQLTSDSDIIMTLLTNAAAIDAVYLGADGLLAGHVAGKLFIEMSTVRPGTERTMAEKARAKGAALIDCPVGGTVGPAQAGTLLGLAGGEAADVARAKPILDQLCRKVEYVGAIGAGATIKLAMNLTTQVYWQSFGEALSLCKPLGLDPDRLMELFVESSGAPRVLHHRAGDVSAALRGLDISPVNFDVDSVRKDLVTILEEAASLRRKLPVAERALECFDQAAREGHGSRDCAILPALWSQRAE